MSIKQALKISRGKTNDEIDLCTSSSKVVSTITPVISKEPEHSGTILSIGDFDATKKNVSEVSNKSGSYAKYSSNISLEIRKRN